MVSFGCRGREGVGYKNATGVTETACFAISMQIV